eukprot:Blabericola_migrator_1__8624@NODE_4519_length_1110_cov_11_494727_g2798_i0_p1_GENE_NODE_4519_length_1110_cov_11_494727_g2798_i0NODE_4519_length_1110_cov_11_494727_g2798_i0_p1_ORF_typecomplete_len131_score19_29Serendipity_A/PF05482_12/0_0011DUF2785/PF10978_8/0_047_NODE_4519_length_1110_cov_11_494727_g2798_i0281673
MSARRCVMSAELIRHMRQGVVCEVTQECKWFGTDGSLVWDRQSTIVKRMFFNLLNTEASVYKIGSTVLEFDEEERLLEVVVKSILTISSSEEKQIKSIMRSCLKCLKCLDRDGLFVDTIDVTLFTMMLSV